MIDLTKNNRFIKILSIISFLLIIIALFIILVTPAAEGYEISIYNAFPSYFWFLMISAIIIGIFILLSPLFMFDKSPNSKIYIFSMLIIIFCNSLFLALPFFREYGFFPSGDALSHVGWMKDLQITGYISGSNFYPLPHILGVTLLDFTGLSVNIIVNIMWVLQTVLFFLGMCLLSKIVTNNLKSRLCIIALSAPLFFSFRHALIHPAMFSLFFIPLLLYFYFKVEKEKSVFSFIFLLIIIAFTITFSHPITSIFVILFLFSLIFSRIISTHLASYSFFKINNIPGKRNYFLPLLMTVTFFIWYFSYSRTIRNIQYVLFFTKTEKETLFESTISFLDVEGLSFLEIFKTFMFRYGSIFILLVLTGLVVLYVVKDLFKGKKIDFVLVDFSFLFSIGLFFSLFSLFGYTGEYDPVRISRFFLLFGPLLLGLGFYNIFYKKNNKKKKKIYTVLLFFIICIIASLSIFNVYGSQLVVRQNFQVTQMDIEGADWFLNHQNNSISTSGIGVNINRYEHFIFGVDSIPNLKKARFNPYTVPTHFGYNGNKTIKETFSNQSQYLLIAQNALSNIQIIPEEVRDAAHQYTPEDFAKLRMDQTISKIYVNGEFQCWKTYQYQ